MVRESSLLHRPIQDAGTGKHVVIIGAGFAGLEAAKILAEKTVRVSVIDRRNHHLFQPLLYQVATAGLSPGDIAVPIRSVLRDTPNTDVLMANVEGIDPTLRLLRLDHGEEIVYDYLILATGATHSYFNHPEWSKLAPGLKTLEDATDIRRRILTAFEAAERATSKAEQDALMTFVIVGGGPTGLEMAGAISELAHFTLAAEFNHIKPTSAKVVLIEAGPRLLAQFSEESTARATWSLKKLGVEVRLQEKVMEIRPEGVYTAKGLLPARTVIWAAGVQPSALAKDLGCPLDRSGRALVAQDLSVPGHPEIFVAGDLAAVPWYEDDKGQHMVPGMAPGAMQEGRHAARNVLRLLKGEPTRTFRYRHKGSMATIGRAAAVVDLGKLHFGGFLAWLTWLFVHIFYLIGFRNRVLVIFQWAWSYLTFGRGTRLITGGPGGDLA